MKFPRGSALLLKEVRLQVHQATCSVSGARDDGADVTHFFGKAFRDLVFRIYGD